MVEEREIDVLADIASNLHRIATALETISNELGEARQDAARCAHGVTGLCMSCVIQNDLLRPQVPRR